ncbi:Hypothetical protein DEACI_0091 [Acididesulfobacillus acetoxydans]|uniref:Uncharacterized protein n=1 Tax=Acididesulfobacillus acetoxydans TaxID=1561005 RepID=A0A8S0W642_9FIRM|nr:hypothetical protein [Acididesulfobacillus acetoxydans]CAA7599469.1 Hypothetical protein DEACI_0091 [Acididesulfobacillus acetoxydans]CEJ06726.1 Hypothetical protein DEACI_1176 [Acididesulfobacillus acetoxydans]
MAVAVVSAQEEVEEFLRTLKAVLMSPGFDAECDLVLAAAPYGRAAGRKRGPNASLQNGFKGKDWVYPLMGLEAEVYLQTLWEESDSPQLFWTFVKATGTHDRCLRFRIRDRKGGRLLGVQLEIVRFPFLRRLPYARAADL